MQLQHYNPIYRVEVSLTEMKDGGNELVTYSRR